MPVFTSRVPAGSPAPAAETYADGYIDLFTQLFPDPENMGWAFASGDSMIDIGIFDGTPLLIHFTREPKSRDVVIGLINGEQTVKILHLENGKIVLRPKNNRHQPIAITPEMDFKINGVVVNWLGRPFSR